MLQKIMTDIQDYGGNPFIVGGAVRDHLLGKTPKDTDVEVYGMSCEQLIGILSKFGKVDQVGISFGVIKLYTSDGKDYDFSLPRRENKSGNGHKGFIAKPDPTMTLQEAAGRRDYTINAISMTPDGQIIDPYGGADDLKNRVLRHTSNAFGEDPLRVLRGMQFAGRMGMKVDGVTAKLCHSLRSEYAHLAKERVWGEWYKWAAKSIKPSAGLSFLHACHWDKLYPAIKRLQKTPQDRNHHPEGSVWQHTLYVCDVAAEIAVRENLDSDRRAILVFAALCHDFGKPSTTIIENGRIKSPGHDDAGQPIAIEFMLSIGAPEKVVHEVGELTKLHMRHVFGDITPKAARRMVAKMQYTDIDMLMMVMEADHSGRPPLPKGLPESAKRLRELAQIEVNNNTVAQWAMGRHLIEHGFQSSPRFGEVLRHIYEQQLDGMFQSAENAISAAVAMMRG